MKGPKPVIRCCACRAGVFEARHRVELHWLEPRGRYKPVLCYRCINRLQDALNARVNLHPARRAVMPTVTVRRGWVEQAHRAGL